MGATPFETRQNQAQRFRDKAKQARRHGNMARARFFKAQANHLDDLNRADQQIAREIEAVRQEQERQMRTIPLGSMA